MTCDPFDSPPDWPDLNPTRHARFSMSNIMHDKIKSKVKLVFLQISINALLCLSLSLFFFSPSFLLTSQIPNPKTKSKYLMFMPLHANLYPLDSVRDRKTSKGCSQKEIWVLKAPLFWVIVRSRHLFFVTKNKKNINIKYIKCIKFH